MVESIVNTPPNPYSFFLRHANHLDTTEVRRFQEGMCALENWGVLRLFFLLKKAGLFRKAGEIYHIEDIHTHLAILPKYIHLLVSLLNIFCDYGLLIQVQPNIYECSAQPFDIEKSSNNAFERIVQQYAMLKPNANFLNQTLSVYFSVMRGESSFLTVMFPAGSFELIEAIYKHNPDSIYFNQVVTEWLRSYIHQVRTQKQFNILEIGAGIGSTTEYLLPMLHEKNLCKLYTYTDISKAFTHYGEKQFGAHYPFLEFERFDIQKPASLQQIPLKHYDIVIATNVLHIAKDIHIGLHNITQILKTGGSLIINEGIKKGIYATLVYGLTDGWWAFEDDAYRIDDSPFIDLLTWKKLLTQHGYGTIQSMNELLKPNIHIIQDVISATLGSPSDLAFPT